MKYINIDYKVPFYNFALEEYLLTEAPEDDYVFFYIHMPSIIVGKFQNTIEEVNKEFVDSENILVARRLSGGGAVYHDSGNLNFSFVQKAFSNDVNNFVKFTKPVIGALNSLGINAMLSGRNDIVVDDKKISGNAQCYKNGRLLHHGTLLYNADMNYLIRALKVKDLKIQSKGIKSVRSRVANLIDYMETPMDIYAFRNHLLDYLKQTGHVEELVLSDDISERIEKRALSHFSTWDWNWGNSPKYESEKTAKFECGIINVKLNIEKGYIRELKIFGDFFTSEDLEKLETMLVGARLNKLDLEARLSPIDIGHYFNKVSNDEFIDLLISQ
ncbi:MAG TPA: lipoate--protein ligase [Clostridiales bacterium]|nr:lipoate--protein ligase [Clostridiales bacterium]